MRFIVRTIASALALGAAAALIQGIAVTSDNPGDQVLTLLGVAVIFGLINAIVRPVVRLFTLPLFVLTLGLFTFVVNALMLLLTSWISEQLDLAFVVEGFGAAFLGALVISVVSFVINVALPDKYEG
jgi:putative membrane protein